MCAAVSASDPRSPEAARPGADGPAVALVYAQTPAERAFLESWLRQGGPSTPGEALPVLRAGDPSLDERLSAVDGDPQVWPLRVAWLPRERAGHRRAGLSDFLTLTNPRRPGARAQERILRQQPERCQVVVGDPAAVSELRRRYEEEGGERFGAFVERQGVLALERAERGLVGDRYKVPRLVSEDIRASARFRETVRRLAGELERTEEDVEEEAAACLDEMVASQSRLAIDLWSHFGRWLARAYTLDVDTNRIEELRELNRGHALAFLPSHRSYLDPLVLRPALQETGLPPNHVLGGANLAFWPMGALARRTGMVFIRRSFRDAPVYKAVLREYIGYLVRKRFNLEWYIEGGRTRTGKLRPPRYGVLAYLVDAFREAGAEDVFLVPVSIVYDQLYEVGAMAAEEHGAQKKAESLGWLVRYARSQGRGFGKVHLRFGEPLSLRKALAEDGSVPKTAFEVCHRINRATPVTPMALVTLGLLGTEDRAVTIEEGRSFLRPLIEYVTARELPTTDDIELGRPGPFRTALAGLVREGVVTEFTGGAEPVYAIGSDKHLEAAFYRNNVIHFFVTRAITELALVRAAEQRFEDQAAEVWEEALRLRDLLKFEFFFPGKREFAEDMRQELSLLDPDWESRPAECAEIRARLSEARTYFAHVVLRPFLEAYQVVADLLEARDPRKPVEEKAFLEECTGLAQQYRMQRRLYSPESISRELFRGALRLAANRDLVDPGRDELQDRRRAFAAEVRDVVRRIGVIRALALEESRDPGRSPWETSQT